MNQANSSNSLLTAIVVILESILTLILRFDSKLRQTTYPLANSETLVCVRCYVPHEEVYIRFTVKGILLDTHLPHDKTEADVTINAYSFQLFLALLSNDVKTIDKLQIRGEAEKVTWVKDFLLQLGVSNLVQSFKTKFMGADKQNTDKQNKPKKTVEDYQQKIQNLHGQLDNITIENKKLTTQLKEQQSKQKIAMIIAVVASILAVVAFIL